MTETATALSEPAASEPPVTIRDVRTICTAPEGIRLVIVKVDTNVDGLYGLGCATFTQRPLAVVTAVEEYLKPFALGRDVNDIEDCWRAALLSSYWRQGPVLNNALSGLDMALWDIKGKRCNMPVYQLFGGRARRAAEVYVHASGRDAAEVTERAAAYVDQGFRHVRCQVAVPGSATYGAGSRKAAAEGGLRAQRDFWDPAAYCRLVPRLFEHLRTNLGEDVELLHDVHERVPLPMALQLAKDLEPCRLFFLEDLVAPEDHDHLRLIRSQTSVPIAMGELFTNVQEYLPLIRDRVIDFIRVHLSDIGGLTPARKLAALAEYFGVRTAWHGPGDASPVAHAANLQLDVSCANFGLQELALFGERTLEVFPGCPEVHDGALWPSERPGLGIEIDEKAAANYPFPEDALNGSWLEIRHRDGSITTP